MSHEDANFETRNREFEYADQGDGLMCTSLFALSFSSLLHRDVDIVMDPMICLLKSILILSTICLQRWNQFQLLIDLIFQSRLVSPYSVRCYGSYGTLLFISACHG